MNAPAFHTDPTTGIQYFWNGQQWQPIAPVVPAYSVSMTKKRTSHGFHLFMTVITGGLWGIFVWLPITLWHQSGIHKQKTTTRQY